MDARCSTMQLEPITSCSLADLGEHRKPFMAVGAGVSAEIPQHRDPGISLSRNPAVHTCVPKLHGF